MRITVQPGKNELCVHVQPRIVLKVSVAISEQYKWIRGQQRSLKDYPKIWVVVVAV